MSIDEISKVLEELLRRYPQYIPNITLDDVRRVVKNTKVSLILNNGREVTARLYDGIFDMSPVIISNGGLGIIPLPIVVDGSSFAKMEEDCAGERALIRWDARRYEALIKCGNGTITVRMQSDSFRATIFLSWVILSHNAIVSFIGDRIGMLIGDAPHWVKSIEELRELINHEISMIINGARLEVFLKGLKSNVKDPLLDNLRSIVMRMPLDYYDET